MTILAIHDSAGTIASVVTCEGGSHPVLTLPPGFSMTEVELPEDLSEDDLKTPEGVTRLSEGYRVEVAPAEATLVSR